jgi:hypothetical protein
MAVKSAADIRVTGQQAVCFLIIKRFSVVTAYAQMNNIL